jgi:hypothetical protein
MKKTAVILLVAGFSAGLLTGADAPRERKVQFSLLFNMTSLTNSGDETKLSVGAEGLVIFNLGRHLMIMPEVVAGSAAFSVGLTINLKFDRFFVGAGGTGGGLYDDRTEWNPIGLLKVQAGIKGPHFLVTAAYVNNLNPGNWPTLSGFSLAAGLVF